MDGAAGGTPLRPTGTTPNRHLAAKFPPVDERGRFGTQDVAPAALHPPHFVAAVSPKIPAFWAHDPALWFLHLDGQFAISRITDSATKFNHAMVALPSETLASIRSLVSNPGAYADPYAELRARLCQVWGKTKWERCDALLDHPGLGADRPSVMVARMEQLKPADLEDLYLALILRRLPISMREHLSRTDWPSAAAMAAEADKIWSARGGAAAVHAEAAAAAVPRSPSPSITGSSRRSATPAARGRDKKKATAPRQPPDGDGRCFYHFNYGSKARNCQPPCSQAGNSQTKN
jgi:hypothetical protein